MTSGSSCRLCMIQAGRPCCQPGHCRSRLATPAAKVETLHLGPRFGFSALSARKSVIQADESVGQALHSVRQMCRCCVRCGRGPSVVHHWSRLAQYQPASPQSKCTYIECASFRGSPLTSSCHNGNPVGWLLAALVPLKTERLFWACGMLGTANRPGGGNIVSRQLLLGKIQNDK